MCVVGDVEKIAYRPKNSSLGRGANDNIFSAAHEESPAHEYSITSAQDSMYLGDACVLFNELDADAKRALTDAKERRATPLELQLDNPFHTT